MLQSSSLFQTRIVPSISKQLVKLPKQASQNQLISRQCLMSLQFSFDKRELTLITSTVIKAFCFKVFKLSYLKQITTVLETPLKSDVVSSQNTFASLTKKIKFQGNCPMKNRKWKFLSNLMSSSDVTTLNFQTPINFCHIIKLLSQKPNFAIKLAQKCF